MDIAQLKRGGLLREPHPVEYMRGPKSRHQRSPSQIRKTRNALPVWLAEAVVPRRRQAPLAPRDNARLQDRVIHAAEVQPLEHARRGVLSRVVPEADERVAPRAVLEHPAYEREQHFRAACTR